jgi:hypothetical protein
MCVMQAADTARTEEKMSEIRRLTCCCCGGSTRGRQWHNRDTGYGLCARCYEWIRNGGKESPEDMLSYYGEPGIHHSIVESPDAI